MGNQVRRIQWAKKISRAKIWRLYQTDARGLVDEALIDEVGTALYERCQSIIWVTEANKVSCPQCHHLIICPEDRWSKTCPVICPVCDWQATYGQWRHSWRHQDLKGGNAMYAFSKYLEKYPKTKTPRDQMFVIDRLINAFHWSMRRQRHHGPAANQLIVGKPDEVLAFLDKLAGNNDKGRDR